MKLAFVKKTVENFFLQGRDYLRGHFEHPPYDNDSMRSVYHIRNLETFRLRQLAGHPPDVMLSHDWPRGVYNHGDAGALVRRKRHFQEEIATDTLGSRPTQELMEALRPEFWFSAHLHVKFPALVEHEDGSVTKFLALDKCLPRRQFLQVLEIGDEVGEGGLTIEYDPEWLAVLKSTDHLLSVQPGTTHMPGPGFSGRFDFAPTEEELEAVRKVFGGDFSVPRDVDRSARAYDDRTESIRDLRRAPVPAARRNSQTVRFCQKLGVRDPMDVVLEGNWPERLTESQKKNLFLTTIEAEVSQP